MAGTLYIVATPIGNLERYDPAGGSGFWGGRLCRR